MTTRQTTERPRPIERHPGDLASEVLDDLLEAIKQRRGDLAAEMADDLRRMVSIDGYAPPPGLSRYATTTFAHAAAGLSIHLPGGEFGAVIPKGEPAEGDELPGPLAILAACQVDEDESEARDIALDPIARRAAIRAARRWQRRSGAAIREITDLPPLDDELEPDLSGVTGLIAGTLHPNDRLALGPGRLLPGDEFPEPTDDAITEAAAYEAARDVFADLTGHITVSEGVS